MMRQLHRSGVLGERLPVGTCLAFAGDELGLSAARRSHAAPTSATEFPRRPDASVVNAAIPLFYVGQNRNGAWVVREAEGRSGGLFLFKQSAERFARRQSAPGGCAIMFLAEPVELDMDNHNSRNADSVSAIGNAARQTPLAAGFVGAAIAAWRRFVTSISRNLAAQRRNRVAVERELFGGQCKLSSKNDDDLPIVR